MFTQDRLKSVEAARLQLIDLGDEKTAKTLNWAVLALGCIRAGLRCQDPPALLVADLLDHINALSEQLGDAAPDQRELMTKVNAWLEQREQQVQAQVMRDFGQSAQAALHSGRVWSEIQPVHVHGDPCRYCQRVRDEPCSQFVSRASAEARDCEGLKDLHATGGYELPARAVAELDRMLHARQPAQDQPKAIVPTSTDELVRVALIGDRGAGADINQVSCWQADQLARVAWAVCEYLVGKHPSEGATPAIQEIRRAALNHPGIPESSAGSITPEQLSRVLQILRVKAQAFQPYSFLLINGGVRKVEDRSGAWISRHEVVQLLDETCTDGLESALAASQPAKD